LVLHGTVREVQWTNPHIWIQVLVKDSSGKEVEWSVEGMSPRLIKRYEIERTTIKVGDNVTITIWPLRNGQNGGGFVRVVLPDGKMYGLPVGQKFTLPKPGDQLPSESAQPQKQ
jgi:Family of unknown function (DUF6152)